MNIPECGPLGMCQASPEDEFLEVESLTQAKPSEKKEEKRAVV